ncbi:MAG TPA: Hsp20/alpha crystallin family protein [Micromonosporaceae bacterium]|nr:Hsp20/alpha crystallin family protein [Micromonosporaceae bacterium]
MTPLEWFSGFSLLPFLAPGIRVEDYLDGDTYIIRAELPGIDPAKDATVTYADGVLRLRVTRTAEHKEQARSEFHYGSFDRVIPLPAGAKADTITAVYAAGILTIKVLVGELEDGGKTIPITVGTAKKG